MYLVTIRSHSTRRPQARRPAPEDPRPPRLAATSAKAIPVQLPPISDKLGAARDRSGRKHPMPIRRWSADTVKLDTNAKHLWFILVTALGAQVLGCASAKVGDPGTRADSGTGDTSVGGEDTSNPNGKNDGSTSDALYGPCDPFSNSGCSGDQKCAALQNGNVLSLSCGSKGSKNEGDSCSPITSGGTQTGDDCGDLLACFRVNPDPNYTCHLICPTSGNANACPGTETCSLVVPGLSGLAFCQPTVSCQPLEQTGCPSSDQACYYGTKGAICATAGSVQPGGTCVNANDCSRGSTCLTVGSTGTCSSFCSTASGGTPSCSGASTGGTICSVLAGEANLGSCRVQPQN